MNEDTFIKVRESVAKPVGRLMKRAGRAKEGMRRKSLLLKILIILIAIPLLPLIAASAMFLIPVFIVYTVISAISSSIRDRNGSGSKRGGPGKIKEFKAPLVKRLLQALPFMAVILISFAAKDIFDGNDTAQYIAAFIAIAVNVLMNFKTVRMQNDYAMRDIPVFTQKRGGEQ